jgi:hypothetical protein
MKPSTTLSFRVAALCVPALLLLHARAEEPKTLRFVRHELVAGEEYDSVVPADFTGDGKTDLIAAGPKTLDLFVRKGPGWERRILRTATPEQPSLFSITLQAVDLDGDGDLDLLTCDPHAGPVDWYENPGADQPWKRHQIDFLKNVHSQALQDLDGDGRPELVANTEGKLVWYSLPKDIRAAGPHREGAAETDRWIRHTLTTDGVEGTPHYLSFGKVDGKLRLFAATPDAGQLGWWEPNDPAWKRRTVRAMPGASHLRLADIDGDGKPDLFYGCGHTAGIGWLSGPDFQSEHVIDPGTLAEPHALALADVDGDGALDVVAAARKSGGLHLWRNDGHGRFTPQLVDERQLGMDLRLADLDDDGDQDLVVTGAGGNNLAWFENLTR